MTQRWLITGSSRGLGRALTLAALQAGHRVVATARDPSQLRDLVERHGDAARAVALDVTDPAAAEAAVQAAFEAFGGLDVLVNNAGFVRDRMFVSSSLDEWDAVIRVHLRGHFCPASHAVQFWRAEQKAGRPVDARIINTSSGAGLQGSFSQSAYSAAKGGIASLTLVQAAELGRYGITANALAPAARTRMTEQAFAEKMKRPDSGFDVQDPDNVAPTVVWLGSHESRGVTGCVFELEGGRITLCDGWNDGPSVDKGARWSPAEIGPAIAGLIAARRPQKKVWGA